MNLVYKIDILFLIGIVIFSGLFYATIKTSSYLREGGTNVINTQTVLYNLETIESAVLEIEAANRGFIITGDEDFLNSQKKVEERIDQALKNVKDYRSISDPSNISVLSKLIDRKIELGQYGSLLRRQNDMSSALNFVSTGKGKVVMDSIRQVISMLEVEELKNLNTRTIENETIILNQNRIFLILTAFIIVAVCFLHLHIRKTAKKLIAYQDKQSRLIKELNHQNRQLDDFAHIVSHNIRSPAQNIFTLISLLNKNSTLEDFQFIYDKLSKVSQNLNETLNELIEVLHIKKSEGIVKEKLFFEDVLKKVIQSMQGEILVSKAEITYDFKEADFIEYPKTYLESIIYNLLSNAIKYRSPVRNPVIHFCTTVSNNEVVLKVTDNGLGIDLKKYGKQVFGLKKVFHANKNAKGIGLFMTKTQIEAMDGEIKVESTVNKGSTFIITFGKYST